MFSNIWCIELQIKSTQRKSIYVKWLKNQLVHSTDLELLLRLCLPLASDSLTGHFINEELRFSRIPSLSPFHLSTFALPPLRISPNLDSKVPVSLDNLQHTPASLSILPPASPSVLIFLTFCLFLLLRFPVSTHPRSRLQLHLDDFKMMSLALPSPHKLHIHISPSTGYHQCWTLYESIYPLNFPIWVNHVTVYPITQVRVLGIVSNSSFSLISASERSIYSFNSTS